MRFKMGDRVEIIDPAHRLYGLQCVVASRHLWPPSPGIYILNLAGGGACVSLDEIRHLSVIDRMAELTDGKEDWERGRR